MGEVYLGVDTHTQKPVAIKMLRAEAVGRDPKVITRFQREGEVLRQLDHPNIVKMWEWGMIYHIQLANLATSDGLASNGDVASVIA